MRLILVIILFLFFSCTHFNSSINRYIEKDYYTNGKIKYKIQKFNDKIDGYAKYWDEYDNIINIVHYSNGILHGEWKEFYSNGNIKFIVNYEYGLKQGKETWNHYNGNKKSEVIYDYGIIISDIIRWDEKGKLIYR